MANKPENAGSLRVIKPRPGLTFFLIIFVSLTIYAYGQCIQVAQGAYHKTWQWRDLFALDSSTSFTDALAGFTRPIEWDPQYATAGTRNALRDVVFQKNGTQGWAVGAAGTILKTSNKGKNWDPLFSDTNADLLEVRVLDDNLRGWAIGEGRLLLSTDGNWKWTKHQLNSDADLRHLQATGDGRQLWIVTANGTLLHSENTGKTWDKEKNRLPPDVIAFRIDNEQASGIAVTGSGTVLQRSNKAEEWKTISTTIRLPKLTAGYFADSDHAWVVSEAGDVIESQDAGKHWRVLVTPKPDKHRFVSLFYNPYGGRGCAVDSDGNVFSRSLGASNWNLEITGPASRTADGTREAEGDYHVFPALWWWLLSLALASYVILSRNYTDEPLKIGSALESDQPIERLDQDRYARRTLVEGLLGLLRNISTIAPLTVAVTGPWGTGKSSVMNLTAHEMRQGGHPVFEFNAWHHDSDAQCLASLLDHLRSSSGSGLSLYRRMGIRLGIGLRRCGRGNWESLAAVLLSISTIFFFLGLANHHPWSRIPSAIAERWLDRPTSKDGFPVSNAYVEDNADVSWINVREKWFRSANSGQRWDAMDSAPNLPERIRCPKALNSSLACAYQSDDQKTGFMLDKNDDIRGIVNGKPVAHIVPSDKIFRTRNARNNAARNVETGGNARFTAIALDRSSPKPVMWLGTNFGELYRSADGGDTWLAADLPPAGEIASVGFLPDGSAGWLFTRRGDIYLSKDHGMHWDRTGRVATGMLAFTRDPTTMELAGMIMNEHGRVASGAIALLSALMIWIFAGSGPFVRLQTQSTTFWQTLRNTFSLASTDEEAGFRHKFRREFALYCDSCSKPPVIMIDDLDRCHPERVVMILEVVNFLSSAGKCYILLGLDWDKVRQAVGLAFESMALEDRKADASAAKKARAAYADNYLKKIISMCIPVPDIIPEKLI